MISAGLHRAATAPRIQTEPARRPTGRLPLPVALYVLTVVVPIGISLGPLLITGLRGLMLVLIVPLFLRLLMGRYGKVMLPDILFPLHVVWMAVALAVNNPDRVIEQVGSLGVEFLGGYLIGRAYIRTREVFWALVRWLLWIVVLMLPFAVYETLTGKRVVLELLSSLPGTSTLAYHPSDRRLGLERVQMTFAHPIHFGLFCSVVLSLVFVGLENRAPRFNRIIIGGIVGLCGFLALSSGAFLAILLQVGLICWSATFYRVRWRWWLLTGLFALAYILIDLLSNRTPMRVFMSYATFSTHTAYWRSIIFEWGLANVIGSTEKGIPGSPYFGLGLGDWVRPVYMVSGSMDNFWLLTAVRYGVPGFLLLVVGYTYGILQIIRRNLNDLPDLLSIRRAWVFTFLGLTFTLCTVHIWSNIYSFVFFIFGAGMWLVEAQSSGSSTTETKGGLMESARLSAIKAETTDSSSKRPRFSRFEPRRR